MFSFLAILLLMTPALMDSKPLSTPPEPIEETNEIDHGTREDHKGLSNWDKDFAERDATGNEKLPDVEEIASAGEKSEDESAGSSSSSTDSNDTNNGPPSNRPFAWLLTPFAQKIQLNAQNFFQDRLKDLRETLTNLGVNVSPNESGKQLGANFNGLLHLVGLNDSGFYTHRLEPQGFLGGNGWFANKGGILGGPGAILSTGSLLTDYPTPYRK